MLHCATPRVQASSLLQVLLAEDHRLVVARDDLRRKSLNQGTKGETLKGTLGVI